MINEYKAKRYCKEEISKIENYEQAVNDTTQVWDLHHRDEVQVLPSGITVIRSRQELKENDRYYNCPANELIFLTHAEHAHVHNCGELNSMYGKTHTEEARRKISEANKGRSAWNKGKTMSEEFSRKMSEVKKGQVPWNKGKTMSEEFRIKMSESSKGRIPWNKGKKGLKYKNFRKRTDINNNVTVTSTESLN